MYRITLEPSFILHSRPFSNTSLIIEIFSQQHGKLALLARSARGLQSRFRNQLQLFTPLLLSWTGRNELKNLAHAEYLAPAYHLPGNALMCGFYLNELMQRLLHRDDPHPALFDDYRLALQALMDNPSIETTLRLFEKRLLKHLGYGLPLQQATDSTPIQADKQYQYIPDYGFVPNQNTTQGHMIFSGMTLIALDQEKLHAEHLLEAKHLMRLALTKLLGNKPLKSRELLTARQ